MILMTRSLNPVFSDRPQSVSPRLIPMTHSLILLIGLIVLLGWSGAAAEGPRQLTEMRYHALPSCSLNGATYGHACISTSVTNLCEAVSLTTKTDKAACMRRGANAGVDEQLWAPLPYHGVVMLRSRVRVSANGEDEANLSFYLRDTPCDEQAAIGYLGLSDDGFPLIETDRGVVEITSPNLTIGMAGARILIDAESGKILNEFLAPRDHEPAYGFRFVAANEVYFATDSACIDAPSSNPGKLQYASRKCGNLLKKDEHGHKRFHHGDEGLESALDSDVRLAAQIVPWMAEYHGERFKSRIYRIVGEDVIVINTVEACT